MENKRVILCRILYVNQKKKIYTKVKKIPQPRQLGPLSIRTASYFCGEPWAHRELPHSGAEQKNIVACALG